MKKSILVVGGGIVGVCSALALQQAGHSVTLIDRKAPGRETSYGNAGVLAEASVVVLNNPALLKKLPKLLLTGSKGLRYSPAFLLKRLGWFVSFLAKATKARTKAAAVALRALHLVSLDQHKQWIKDAGVDDLMTQAGWLKVFRSEATYNSSRTEYDLMAEVGVNFTVYEREHLRQLEPGLKPIYCRGIMLEDNCSIANPADLTDAYVAMFIAAGGSVCHGEVCDISTSPGPYSDKLDATSRWAITLGDGTILRGDDVVIAAGAWSAEIASWLDYDIPMAWERGYHVHMEPGDGPKLTRPVYDVDGAVVIAPMHQGIRITSGVELVDRDAPKNLTQINTAIEDARAGYEMKGQIEDEPWMGRRPTLVDSLPIIGAAPRHDGLWFNFGHQHIGLSVAPGSALAIAAMMDGGEPPMDMKPFRASRFPL